MILHHGGFPIRKSAGHWIFAPNRSLSQLVTSFVGSWCQGIHLMLFLAWTSCISLLQHLIAFEFRNWLFEVFIFYTVFAFLAKSVVLHLKRKNLCYFKVFLNYLSVRFRFSLFGFQWTQSSSKMKTEQRMLRILRCVTIFDQTFVPFGTGGLKWTRTTDLALIRRAL